MVGTHFLLTGLNYCDFMNIFAFTHAISNVLEDLD